MLSLIKNDLKNAFGIHTLLTIILLVGITISFLTVKMMLGVVQFQINAAKNLNTLHSFTVDFDGESSRIDIEHINNIIGSVAELPNVLLIKTSDHEPMIIGFKGQNNNRWYVHDEGVELSPEDELNATNNIVVSPGLYNRPNFAYADYPLEIYGQRFNIIGIGIIPQNNLFFSGEGLYEKYYPYEEQIANVHDHDHEEGLDYVEITPQYQTILMPFSTYCKQGYSVDLVTFMYQYKSNAEFEDFSELLRDTFPNSKIYFPTTPHDYYSGDMNKQLMQAVALIFAALVNIAALFVYWLSINRRVHGVYMLCGATRKSVIKLMAIEWGVLIILSFILSLIIEILIAPILLKIGVTLDFPLWQTLLILICGYIVTTLFMLPQIRRNANLSQRGYSN